jgi:hypothetical protein
MVQSVRKKRKRARDRIGIALIVLVVLVIAGGGAGYFYLQQTRVALDETTLCPKDGARTLTVVLVDRTDPLNTVQKEALRDRLQEIQDNVAQYGALKIYSVEPIGETLLRPLVDLCNPGRGSDIDPKFGNPRLVEKRWLERFAVPIEALLDDLMQTHEADSSPIMESIQSVAVSTLRGNPAAEIPKRLIIASDMLQHTIEYSQYKGGHDFQEFRKSAYYRRLQADLRGVEVEIIYVRRDTRRAAQGKAHIQFWRDYISDLGGTVTRVVALEG